LVVFASTAEPAALKSSILMSTAEIARRLVALCREAKWEAAQKELYAADAVSIEPHATPAFEAETRGLDAILEKGRKFSAMVEQMHTLTVSDPLVADNSFACTMRLDATMKGRGRMDMTELCVYDVKNGKIVAERFHL
jgi:limonene-1,2-epoxide hydrolase